MIFTEKWALAGHFSSIRMIPSGETTEISVPSQPLIRFFLSMVSSPRRSIAPGKLSAPGLPFYHINVGSLKQRRDSGQFRASPGETSFGKRPLGETALPGPKRARFGPKSPFWEVRRSSEGPGGADLVPTAPTWPAGVTLMVTTHFELI